MLRYFGRLSCGHRSKYVVKKDKTPVLTAEEARELFDCIKTL